MTDDDTCGPGTRWWSAGDSPASPRRCNSPTRESRVTLVEGRPRLGGLAFSFRRGDLTVDNGQHVYLRCCTAYRWFLDRVGGAHLAPLQDRLDVPVLDVARPRARVSAGCAAPRCPCRCTWPPASPPIRTSRSPSGRASGAPRSRSASSTRPTRRWTASTSRTWLGRHGQSPRTIEALWDLVGVATLNATAPNASMGLAAMVFKTGLLSEPGAADIGWARVPLGELHDTLARKALDSAGVRTELSHPRPTAVSRGGATAAGTSRWTASGSEARHRRPRRTAARGPRAAARRRARRPRPAARHRHRADPQHPCRLRPQGAAPPVLRRARHPGPVGLRPHRRLRADGSGQYLALSQSAAEDEIDRPSPNCASAICPSWSGCCPPRAAPRYGTSSSPGSGRRPSPRPRASAGCAPARAPARPACTLRARGPPPAGPRPWRVPCAAASAPRVPRSPRSAAPMNIRSRRRHEPEYWNKRRDRADCALGEPG